MPAWQAADIGPLYDYGIATRDGSTLACKNKDGKTVQVSSLAFMASPDRNNTQEEATELQEKASLIQLSSSNLIDREFDQWPQVTQGDWTGGAGQRVAGVSGTFNQYYDGEGILWPLNDYVPQRPFKGPIISAGVTNSVGPGIVGGYVAGAGNGYATIYSATSVGIFHLSVVFQSGDTQYVIQLINGPVAGAASTVGSVLVAHGYVWVILYPTVGASPKPITLFQLGASGGALVIVSQTVVAADLAEPVATNINMILAGGLVGNKAYLAVALSYTSNVPSVVNEVVIYDISADGNPLATLSTIAFPVQTTFLFTELNFEGANLNIGISDGFTASIVQSGPPWTSSTTIAALPGLANAFSTAVGSTLFIVGWSPIPGGGASRMDLYTLSGGVLTEVGSPITPTPFLLAVSSPTAFGGYAFWTVTYQDPGAPNLALTVYAFDVVRSRLFRVLTISDSSFVGTATLGHSGIGIFGTTTRTQQVGATFEAQWGFAISTFQISNRTELAREFYLGVLPLTPKPSFTGLLQMGVDLTSGIIDFTASTNKLFRQLVTSFIGGLVAGASSPAVILSAWFNQDPGQLAPVADFTVTTGTPNPPLPTKLNLVSNKIARKAVYRVQTGDAGLASGVSGAITYTSLGTTASGLSVTVNAPVPVADLVVLCFAGASFAAFDATSTVIDSKGNAWVLDVLNNSPSAEGVSIAHSVLTTALAAGDTVTFQPKNAGVPATLFAAACSLVWVAGLSSPTVKASADQVTSAHGSSTTPAAPAATLALVPEATIGAIACIGTHALTPGAGWTNLGHVGITSLGDLQPVYHTSLVTEAVNANGTFAAAATWWAAQVSFSDTTWLNAPKLFDVIVQAATGWVIDAVFDLSPNAKVNANNVQEYAYQHQSVTGGPSIDPVVAYNFLKQIWRLKGGEIVLTLPNGDSYNALIQQLKFASPKPFAASFRSDVQASFQSLCTLKIREDI